jgi:RNA polymerase sigma-70 factor (ECF subfamily)
MRAVIEEALEDMPVMQRAVLTLRDVEGLPFEEICNILELSASNARVLLHRARQRLWAAIDDYQKE